MVTLAETGHGSEGLAEFPPVRRAVVEIGEASELVLISPPSGVLLGEWPDVAIEVPFLLGAWDDAPVVYELSLETWDA